MVSDMKAEEFFWQYDEAACNMAMKLRAVVLEGLPDVIEQVDIPARMVGYCYGRKYVEMVCTIIPSKKGVKHGFYKGVDLPDPDKLLKGTGKISRYVEIKTDSDIDPPAVKALVANALAAYRQRISK